MWCHWVRLNNCSRSHYKCGRCSLLIVWTFIGKLLYGVFIEMNVVSLEWYESVFLIQHISYILAHVRLSDHLHTISNTVAMASTTVKPKLHTISNTVTVASTTVKTNIQTSGMEMLNLTLLESGDSVTFMDEDTVVPTRVTSTIPWTGPSPWTSVNTSTSSNHMSSASRTEMKTY